MASKYKVSEPDSLFALGIVSTLILFGAATWAIWKVLGHSDLMVFLITLPSAFCLQRVLSRFHNMLAADEKIINALRTSVQNSKQDEPQDP